MTTTKRSKIGFVSLGCPKNLVDTERMISIVSEAGATVTSDAGDADIVVINTCGFLESAKNESLDTIGEFVGLKKKKQIKGVVVAGCMTERYLGLMSEKYPLVDAFIQTKDFSKIAKIVDEITSGDKEALNTRRDLIGDVKQLEGHSDLPDFIERIDVARPYAYVKISEGCNRVCSFCIIPKLRGKHHSRSIEGIFDEVSRLVAAGTTEVILIAQDLTSYGLDRKDGTNLLKLLERIETIEGLRWVRLMYNYPRFFTDELINFLVSSTKFTGYLDIPFQHISDGILRRMKRPESKREIYSLIQKLREKIPGISLRTTVMVGFPGETDEEFSELVEFVRDVEFDHLGAFTYFREEGTPSATLENQVDEETKQKRYGVLMEAQKKAQKKVLKSRIGTTTEVLIDGVGERTKHGQIYRGRHRGQAPDIDGMTYVLSDQALKPGMIIQVQIDKIVGDYDLLAHPLANSSYAPSAVG